MTTNFDRLRISYYTVERDHYLFNLADFVGKQLNRQCSYLKTDLFCVYFSLSSSGWIYYNNEAFIKEYWKYIQGSEYENLAMSLILGSKNS